MTIKNNKNGKTVRAMVRDKCMYNWVLRRLCSR